MSMPFIPLVSNPPLSFCVILQVLIDPETFRGINSRLPELGGVVLDAVEKLRKAYFACSNVPLYAPTDPGGKPSTLQHE